MNKDKSNSVKNYIPSVESLNPSPIVGVDDPSKNLNPNAALDIVKSQIFKNYHIDTKNNLDSKK